MRFISYGSYVWAPIAATVVWTGTLLGLLLWWAVEDKGRKYGNNEPTILYVSDSGAQHKWLFVLGAALTFVTFSASLLFERWLRHTDRLPEHRRRRERFFDSLAIFFGICGGIALLCLASWDAFNHSTIHWSFTVVFIVCIALCAIFQTLEIIFLKQDHPDRRHLVRNATLKIVIVGFAVVFAICFGGLYAVCGGDADTPRCNRISSAAATFEWIIAFLFAAFLATFVLDLWPAAKTSPRHLRRVELRKRAMQDKEKNLLHPDSPVALASESVPSTVEDTYPSTKPFGHEPSRKYSLQKPAPVQLGQAI